MHKPADGAKRREDKGKIERQQLDHIRKTFSCSAESAGWVFCDAMAQPKIGTTRLKGHATTMITGHRLLMSGVRQDEEPRLFRDATRLKTRFRFLSTTFCAGVLQNRQMNSNKHCEPQDAKSLDTDSTNGHRWMERHAAPCAPLQFCLLTTLPGCGHLDYDNVPFKGWQVPEKPAGFSGGGANFTCAAGNRQARTKFRWATSPSEIWSIPTLSSPA